MRVYEIGVSADGLPKKIVLSPRPADPKTNWLSILIGENGSRKSLLLRLLVGAALKRPPLRSQRHNSAEAKLECSDSPTKVFAISGTHSDRFPVISGIPFRRPLTTFDIDSFSYFGPRYAGNVATRQRMITTLAYSMLNNSDRFQQRQEGVKAVLSHLGYEGVINLILSFNNKQLGAQHNASRKDVLQKFSEELEGRLAIRKDNSHSELRAFVKSLTEKGPEFSSVLELKEAPFDLVFDLQSGISGIKNIQHSNQLALMVATGILVVEDLMFCRKLDAVESDKKEWIYSDDLSSGQWQLLNGLLNLALNVDDESFVLIDEPENSLHPEWQREYIDLLRLTMNSVHGCHVVIATHSPLITAGVRADEGNIIRLERDEDSKTVNAISESSAFGWQLGDVLQQRFDMDSTRAPELVDTANAVLAIIKIPDKHSEELTQLCQRLRELAVGLPDDDPLRPALDAIIAVGLGDDVDSVD